MNEIALSPTGESLESLIRFCNDFFVTKPFRHTINDLIYWICDKANPHFFKVDGRKMAPSAGAAKITKALTEGLYGTLPGGRFAHESQFKLLKDGTGWWIETSIKQILKLTGNKTFGRHHWSYIRDFLKSKGILRTRAVTCNSGVFWNRFYVQIDFERLKEVLENVPVWKRFMPGTIESGAEIKEPVNRPDISDKGLSSSSLEISGFLAISPVDPGSPPLSERELSAGAEQASSSECIEDQKPIPFPYQFSKAKLDAEGKEICDLLKEVRNYDVTNRDVRRIYNLLNNGDVYNFSASRVCLFLHRWTNNAFDVEWMNGKKMTPEFFLTPRIWRLISRELDKPDSMEVGHTAFDLEELQKQVAMMQSVVKKISSNPDEYLARLNEDFHYTREMPYVEMLMIGARKGWAKFVMDPIRSKVKDLLQTSPAFFGYTDSVVNWSVLLGLTEKEREDLKRRAELKLRSMRWNVNTIKGVKANDDQR